MLIAALMTQPVRKSSKSKRRAKARLCLHVESEERDVAVLHDVVLALAAHKALFLGGGHAAAGLEVVEGDYLRADEAALEVGVNLPGGLGGLGAPGDGPGPDLVAAAGEEADEAQEGVGALD